MFHAALRWPGATQRNLWPLAMKYAVYLHNNTPRPRTGLTPNEMFSGSLHSYSPILNAHPWGSPVYVLAPRLQDGQKLPRWEPRSRQGQFMGVSPLHASTVSLIRNLRTNRLSPQFHCIHDNYFETVHCSPENPPDNWEELCIEHSFRSNLDPEKYIPELSDQWLTPEELQEKRSIHRKNAPDVPPVHTPDKDRDVQSRESTEQRVVNEEMGPYSQPEISTPVEDSRLPELKTSDNIILPQEPQTPEMQLPRKSQRSRREPVKFKFDKQHGYMAIKSYTQRISQYLAHIQVINIETCTLLI